MDEILSKPFDNIISESSPVRETIKILKKIIVDKPYTILHDNHSRSASVLILLHILDLMEAAGVSNMRGYHSASVALFRPMEDALDCFAAIALIENAAEKWNQNKLKASDAAKLLEQKNIVEYDNVNFGEYRKTCRESFNNYSHCSPNLTNWNLYRKRFETNKCTLELNDSQMVITSNAYTIDFFLIAHLYELICIIDIAYKEYLKNNSVLKSNLSVHKNDIIKIIEEKIKNNQIVLNVAAELMFL